MSDSPEYRDGVFVAGGPSGPSGSAGGSDRLPAAPTGTALMSRPDEHLVPVDAPGPLMAAGEHPVGPADPAPTPAPASGGARRIAVATIVASLVAAAAIGAAAFGGAFGSGTPGPGSARGPLGAAAAASAGATSVAFTLSATHSTPSSVTTLASGTGAVDQSNGTGRLTATVPALAGLVGSGDDSLDVVTDGSSVYVGSPALSSLTGSTTWLKADLPQGATTGSAVTSTLAVLADPAQLLGLMSSIGGQVTTVGDVDLDGATTTEYSTTVTLSALAARAGLTAGTGAGARISQVLGQLGNTSVPLRAWVGTDGYVRQLTASIDLSRATAAGLAADLVSGSLGGTAADRSTTATTVTVDFSAYGAPVDVTVPPADQVTDVHSILSTLHGVLSGLGHVVSAVASGI
ncbi:MAG: hypothetical protein ABSF84_14710 [Acidimicrobiales bacterium]|jgi:hypothetical protein